MLYDGNGKKKPKYNKTKSATKEKITPFGCPPFPPSTKWTPTVPENTENKPDQP